MFTLCSCPFQNLKAIYALVLEAVVRFSELTSLLEKSGLLKEDRLDVWLARILVTELLWGKKQLLSDCKPVQTVLSYQDVFNKLLGGTECDAKRKSLKKGNNLFYFTDICTLRFRISGHKYNG